MNLEETARRTVAQTLCNLPEELRSAAESVPVFLESLPDAEITADGVDSEILGLFVGSPRHWQNDDPGPPPQILLYLKNIFDECMDAGTTFEEEVRRTYLHELGHYLGLDESDLAARDLD